MRSLIASDIRIPPWLPAEQAQAFRERVLAALGRRGPSLSPFVRRCIIAGVTSAFRHHRVDDARWGRRMLSRRGTKGRLWAVAMAGEQRRAYFSELGRIGGRRSAAKRRLATMHPHARRVLQVRPPAPRSWMAL